MLDFLGVTENWSTIENIPWTQRWIFSDDATREPVSLDGVTFTGKIYIEGQQKPVTLDIQKSAIAEESNILIVSCIGLPEGRHPYEIYSVSESGNQNRLISGYIGVIKSIDKLVDELKTYASRTLSIRLPGHVTRQIRLEWLSCTLSSISAEQALNAANTSSTNAETASQAAETATGAAATATERAKEAEGFAGAAYASKTAAADSETAASTAAANTARDAKSANEAKTAVESLAANWPETVSEAERDVNAAKEDALAAIRDKQADSVLAVGRASQTAQQNIASAQTDAVSAVQAAGDGAKGTIAPLVRQVETAKDDIDQAERRINTAATNATTSATNAANSATAAADALEAIPQVDAAGNMTLAGNITAAGGTFDGSVNANGGINIPLAVGAPTETAAVNRLYAAGLAAVTEAFSPQSFLSSFTLYGNSVAVDQTVPGQVWKLRKTSEDPGTVQVNLLNPFLGVSNYSGWRGFLLPAALGNTGSTSPRKMTFYLGKPGNVVKKTAADIDVFTLSPASGSTEPFVRFIDVTFYMENDTSTNPAGYPVRVREIIYDSTQAKWLCYETRSVIPSFNTNPSCNMFLTFQQDFYGKNSEAGLWIGSNAADSRRLLCIADMHAVHDTYSWMGVGSFYWDCVRTNSSSFLGAMRQMTAPGNNQPNGTYAAFRALETRLIQSTSVTEFTPYE